MKRLLNYQISVKDDNKTITQFLKEHDFPRRVITNMKKTQNGICINHKWSYVIDHLHEGDVLELIIDETDESSDIIPCNLEFGIIYEDEDILIVNKPANMPIHPSINNYDNTLANAVMYYYRDDNFVFRCINRLDRDTSGLTIIAKNSLSGAILSKQVANRQLHRTYTAICTGHTPDEGTIAAPIGRKSESTIERCVDFKNGERAVTHYRTIGYDRTKDLSLVELQLETGRTHQIRVHMKYILHPLIGDFLYNPDIDYIDRQALHSSKLHFYHPITKKEMQFSIPLPSDMKCIFDFI